jgi:hypothetical protein
MVSGRVAVIPCVVELGNGPARFTSGDSSSAVGKLLVLTF